MPDGTEPRNDRRIERRLDDPARLAAVRATGLLDAPTPPAVAKMVSLIPLLMGADAALVSLVDLDRQFFVASTGLPEPWSSRRQSDLPRSLCQFVVTEDQPMAFFDIEESTLLEGTLAGELGVASYLGMPLRGAGGEVLGATCAISSTPRAWTDTERLVLSTIADVVNGFVAAEAGPDADVVADRVALVAHDLRSPVATLVGAARLFSGSDAADRESLRAVIDRSAAQLDGLVDDLLIATRPHNLDIPLKREHLDLHQLCERLAAQKTATHGVRVTVTAKTPVHALVDQRAMERVVQNLLDNALRHGEAPFEIEVTQTPAGASISVANAGPQIDAEAAALLFGRYRPGTGSGSRTGLGLHIVWRLVTAHGGSVRLVDDPLSVVFRVDLPHD
ncbi:GAF domain-containing sensor histidine kinase [Actinospongicola halichondriae]|uniref:GAF domain-containing sensor histidine kinase n=1 Tax=Actinospongicola halichondriae TaxID=3236844 RepID=UPI003D577013